MREREVNQSIDMGIGGGRTTIAPLAPPAELGVPCLVQFLFLPATVIDFCLDAVFDDESPVFFLCSARLSMESSDELGEFGS
jgi:hypothetical protein